MTSTEHASALAAAVRPIETTLGAELARLRELCPGLQGAAVATRDGLAMATSGVLRADTVSAAAAFVIGELDAHLGLLREGRTREVLVWTDAGPWYLAVIGTLPYLLALLAEPAVPAALLRHAGALGCARMATILAPLADT